MLQHPYFVKYAKYCAKNSFFCTFTRRNVLRTPSRPICMQQSHSTRSRHFVFTYLWNITPAISLKQTISDQNKQKACRAIFLMIWQTQIFDYFRAINTTTSLLHLKIHVYHVFALKSTLWHYFQGECRQIHSINARVVQNLIFKIIKKWSIMRKNSKIPSLVVRPTFCHFKTPTPMCSKLFMNVWSAF